MFKFTIREMLLVTLVVALPVGGCIGRNSNTDEIQYFPPGPEFKKSQGAVSDSLPASRASAVANSPSE